MKEFVFIVNEISTHLVVYRVLYYNSFKRHWVDIGEATTYSLAESIMKSAFFVDDDRANYKIVESSVLCSHKNNNNLSDFVKSHFVVK